jgi:hypothetical protein
VKPSRAVVACRIAAVATVISVLPVVAWAEEPPPPDAPPVYAPGEEVAALRDRFSTTVATATANSYVTTIHSRPVNFRAADGSWQPIDTSFVARADGTLHNAANDVGITVAPTAAQLVHVDIADGVSFGYGLSGALPAIPAVTGSVVTLPSIAPLTNTEVTSRATGLKEEIVLASPLAPTTYVFPLYLHGLTAALDADGNLILSDTTGAERARVPHGWMHDSKVDPHSGDPAESSGVTYALVNSGPTGTALKVTLDPAWLASPLRQYPVRVDPTVTTYTAGSDDTFVEYPYTNDYSTDVLLKSGTWDGGTNKARSFIHFQGADALDDKVINSATVKVWENWSYSCTDSPVNLMRITQSWSGAGLHGYPGFSVSGTIDQTSAHYGYTGCPTQAYVSFDATSAMRNWANDTWQNYGVALVAPDENNSYQWKKWDSAQTTHDPQLVVSWDEPNRAPGQVSGRTITPSTCVGTCTYTTTSDSTPVLTGTATDADADTLRYDFEVYAGILSGVDASGNAAPGSATKVAYGSVSNKASGTQGAWTVSPALADGSYSYRVRAWDGTTYGVWSSGWARFVVDATAPATTVSSSTHPVQTTWYSSNAPTVTWTASTESGVAGYSYVLDQTSSTVADTVSEGTTASKSYTGLADGVWYFHVRTQSKAGVWGTTATFTIRVDVTAPTAPATVTSSPQVPAVPSPNRNVTATWSAGTDATSGVKGYSVVFNNDSATPADTVQDVPATTTSYSSPSLSDGTWWFHVRTIDNAGNASADKTYGPFLIDGTGPDAPVITSPDHSQTAWSTNRTATFAWTTTNGAGGPADATGYSVVFDQAANTDPDTTSETALPAWTQQNIPDGVWYLHVRAVDSANNWGATGSYKVMVDATGPAAPVITSSTHPDEDSAYESNDPSFSWTASDDSGIAGYSVVLDQSQSTVPPATNGGTATTYSANDLDWGQWFLHVRAVNGVGLWGATATFSVSLYPIVDAEARSATTDDPGQTTPLDQVQSLLPAVPHDGPLSGVFPPIDSGLANFYETGPLLGSDSPLGGPFVPNDSPASELGRVVTGMVPPHTALTNIGQTVAEAVGTARSLAQIVPVVVLPAAPTYTLETTPYDANGQPQQTRTDTVPVCTPYVYAPHEQTSYAQAHPTSPIELPALRANLCPDVTSVTSNPRLTYQLDALSANVHARVVVTYQAQGVQIRMVTDAHQNQLPVDSGSGAAINSSYDCQSSTLPVVGPLPLGGTVPQDTQDGFCLELVRLPSDADTQHVQITSDSTGPLDAVEFFQDQPASSSFLPKYHLVVNNLPVSVSHQFDLTARDATAGNRSLYLRLQLADTTVGANETLTLEKYTDSGALNDRLRLSGIPASFDTTFDGVLEDAGDVTTAEVKNATIHGTQTAAPNETLVVEHYSSSTLNDLLTLSSFAADFRFAAEVRKDSAGTLVGGKIDATFQQGVPANGRLQVARYLPDSNGNARLDTYLDMQRFAPATSFETTTRGPASDPTGLVADVSNSTPVTTQVIRALQYPDGGAQRRLVFAGPSATIGQIGDPVLGQNVVWNGAPATYHLDFDVTAQSGSGADPTLPGQVVIQGTASADVATSNLLQVSELRSSGQTVGVNLGSLTQNHYLKINVLGSLSLDGLRSLRIERDSHAANTAQTMQLYVREPSGALSTKVNFTGPQPYTAGLLTQTATTVEGAVSSVPGHFVLAGTFNRDSSNRLNDAHLTGSSPAAAPDMDIVLIEKVRGFSAHLHSLMTTYDYGVHVDYDNNGSPTQAVFTADQSTDNDGAVFDVKYGVNGANLRFVAGGLARTVTDTVKITEGTLSNPLGATITQSQSTDNPNSLLQLVAYPVGSTTARFALTTRNASAGVAPESGSLGDVLWTGVPKNYTLHVSRNLSSSQGAANIDVSLSSARRDADLRMRQVCTGGRTSCTAGSSQQLTIHGLGTSPSFALTYNGSVNSPSALHLRAIDGTRASTDWIELAGYQGTALRDRFVLHGTAASVPSAPAASTIDGDYSGLPGDVSLDYSQVVQSNPARTTVSLTGTTPGHDDPGAVLSVSRTSGSTRQVLTTYGLAPSWSLGGTYDNLHDPNNMLLHLHSSIRHDTDYTSLQNYDSGVYNQKFLFERVEHATVEVLPHKANARFVGYPEDVVLSYVRQQQVVGSRTYDRRFTMTLANSDADGNPVDVGNGYVDASLYDPANVVYDANGYPAANEHIRIDQLPARISNLDYVFPANTITDNTTNCLGDITYNASNSSADLKMTLYSQTDCLAGAVNAKVDDVPKDGFALAALYRDGSGAIVTAADPQFGNQEQTGAVQIDAPLPKGVVDRFNRPVYITSDETATGGDKFICNDAGINAVVKMGCQHIRVTATPHFKDLGLHVSAPSLSYLKIATNVARSTYNAAPHPDRDTDIRDLLWKYVPVFSVDNGGFDDVTVRVTGLDDPSDGKTHRITQHVGCCVRKVQTANFDSTYDITPNSPLNVRFYGWTIKNGDCQNPDPNSTDIKACNANGDELGYGFGSFIHTTNPFGGDADVPFNPRYDTWYNDPGNFANPRNNGFVSHAGTIQYYVPNPYDLFMRQDPGGGAWYARNLARIAQTDWFWASLLHEFPTDPLSMAS